ncbi:MAG TPA: tetratricopeptide repeat protein [Kofleriaceae bacterium]|jgi:tetratricopeptide (TPR) repeat protein|nr:tetratricopeptide repeat protein [Kofleriaceae bacterium]
MTTIRNLRRVLVLAALPVALGLAACGGTQKPATTPAAQAKPAGDSQASNDFGDPASAANGNDTNPRPPGAPAPASAGKPRAPGAAGQSPGAPDAIQDPAADRNRAGGPELAATPQVTMPNYDPDPGQARSQVEQHLRVARQALATPTPDPETALREARLALDVDAANVEAAAMVAFAYYHKRLYDTAELVLDDLFKRDAAKQNANVYYVYGLVYDHTNRPEQAVASYTKAVEINPNHASALVNLGVHQLQNTRYAEALATFDRLVNQFSRTDVVTLTSLGSAYRGHAADYPATSPEHDDNVRRAEAAYKRALQATPSYGPAYYNLGLLYLDNDPFPGLRDNLLRLNTSKSYFDQYKNMPGVDMKLYDERMKDVTKAIKRAEKQQKKSRASAPVPAATPAKDKAGGKRGGNP